MSLQGENFGSTGEVWLDGAGGAGATKLDVVNRVGAGWLAARIPSAASGALTVRVSNSTGMSAPIRLNAAQAHHLDALQIVPGGAFRIFGRNLLIAGSSPSVTVDGAAAGVNVSASDEHMLIVTAPNSLAAKSNAIITVDNGNGSGASTLDRPISVVTGNSGDPFNLGVGWAAAFSPLASRTIDAASDSRLSSKAACNGSTDDKAAIQNAVNLAASNGGGVVSLPAGTCRLTGIVFLKSNVVLQGTGKTSTTLKYESDYPIYMERLDLAGVRNLGLVNAGSSRQGPLVKYGSRVFLQNVSMNLGTTYQVFVSDNRNIVITGSDFIQTGSMSQQGPYYFGGTGGLVFTNNTTSWMQGAPQFPEVHDAFFQGNTFTRDGSFQNAAGVVHSFAMDFAHRIAVVGNTFNVKNGPITNHNRNDGETLLTEGGGGQRTENIGTVASATATTISDPANTSAVDAAAIAENYGIAIVGGKGAGQTRRLTAYASGKMTVDRAWDVVPDSSSRYATFVWGLEKALIKGNTLSQNPRGIWLYHTAIRDVDIVGNTISEGGGIFLRSFQKLSDKMFTPHYNIRIAKNRISNTTGNWTSHINAVFVNADAKAFGIAKLGIEIRDNQITANRPNISNPNEDYTGSEGYMNLMKVENYSLYETMSLPRMLGTIFQRNVCTNCDVAVRLGTGAGGSILSGTQLVNSTNLWTNTRTTVSGETATATIVE